MIDQLESINGIAAAIRQRQVSIGEVVASTLTQIDLCQHDINAFITIMADRAMERAAELDAELSAGLDRGVLMGVPVALKDVFDVAGVPTTAGSALLANNVARHHATSTNRLLDAGAVIVGKTNMDEFAFGPNQHAFGRTNCPADHERYAGGSSGGSAAAVATGCAWAALGTDAGGSVRYPAACCGVVGYKPTFGRFDMGGVFPSFETLDHVGVLARTTEDVVAVSDALATPDHLPSSSPQAPTVGIVPDWAEVCSQDVIVAVTDALQALGESGATIIERPSLRAPDVFETLLTIVTVEAASSIDPVTGAASEDSIAPAIRRLLAEGRRVGGVAYLRAQQHRTRLRSTVDEVLDGVDLLALPTISQPALRWDDPNLSDWSIARFLPLFNLTGHPAVSLPLQSDPPLGLQLVGKPHGDQQLLSAAEWVMRHIGPT